ncbi:MAG: hypothetical protein WA373_04825 [Burkholderiales bacterium]
MKYFPDDKWNKLPISDFRPRFFIETYLEKLSMYTPHFYQSRLMSVHSSCAETLTYIEEYRDSDKNAGYILSALDEIESSWGSDPVAHSLFAYMEEPRNQLFKKIRGGDLSPSSLNRLSVVCQAILSREEDYATAIVAALQEALTGDVDLSQKDRITRHIYALTGLYTTHLLNKGYSPTYLYNRAEMFTRENNYSGKSFQEQFQLVTERLRSHKSSFDVYFALRANRPRSLLEVDDDPNFQFSEAIPECIQGQNLEKLKKDIELNVVVKAKIESTDYVSAAWRVKEKLDKLLDAVTALELNPRIKTSANCVVIFQSQHLVHTRTLNIDLLLSFLASEGGTYFSSPHSSIRHALATLDEQGKEHLGRSLRYLRLARESISIEQKLLNLWIALESLFSDGESGILVNILEYVPQIYAISGLRRRVSYLKDLLVKNKVATTERVRSDIAPGIETFNDATTESHIFALLRNEAIAIDLFNSLGTKEHLKFKLMSIFLEIKTNGAISKRIKRSEMDVTRQLRRIYFLRNKMAHRGHYENIRPQLVTHLLDYIAVCYMAMSASAGHARQENNFSIGDLLAAYKLGADVVLSRCRSSDKITKVEEIVPVPII